MKMDKNMDLYNMIVEMDSKEKIFKEIAINMICQKMKLSKDEYYNLSKKIISHRNIMNVDIDGSCKIYGNQTSKNNNGNEFVQYFEKVLNITLLEDIFDILNRKNFKYDLTQIGVHHYGWADEQLFIQSFLLQKIYQYMIINREDIQNEKFVHEYYNCLIQVCESSESFEEVLKKCDDILIRNILQKENFSKTPKETILNLIRQKYINDGYCFHGFNSNFEETVLKYGLSGEFNCCDVESMKMIDDIFRKNGITDSFQQNWDYQLYPNFFTTDNFGAAYYYSILSPVFLSRLVSNGKYMIDEARYNRTAFFNRNMSACMDNMKMLLSEYNVSKRETEIILTYLGGLLDSVLKNNDTLKIALVQRQNINRDFSIHYDKALFMRNILSMQDLILLSLKPSFELDRHQNVTYSPEIVSTIHIPNFTKKLEFR